MPIYDCGDPECTECQRAFGPDRTKAIANYKAREAFYATLKQKQVQPPAMTRHDRLIKFIEPFYWSWDLRRTVFDGRGNSGIQITLDDLTDEALARLAERLRADFWFNRKLNRQNREIARARG